MSFNEWKLVKLNEIAEITMGQSPKGEDCNNTGIGEPLLNGPTEFGESHPYPTQFTTNIKKSSKKGDVLFCVRGSTAGRMNWSDRAYAIGRGIAAISPKNKNTNYFIRACLECKLPQILKRATGSTFPNITRSMLTDMEILIPSLDEMEQLDSFIKSITEKIEANNKINKKLEEMAQAIFKQWFVNFEFPNKEEKPYKSSGGEMVESEMGMIPKGWEVSKLSELGNLIMGVSPKSSSYNTSKIGAPLLNGASDFENGLINAQKYTTEPNKMCCKNDLIFCVRATIGNITFADKEYCLGRGVASITPKNNKFIGLLYYNLLMSINKLISNATGSVFLSLSKPSINNLKLIIPSEKTLEEFSTLINNILDYKHANQLEIQKLNNTRDLLLPKLMSGEIRV